MCVYQRVREGVGGAISKAGFYCTTDSGDLTGYDGSLWGFISRVERTLSKLWSEGYEVRHGIECMHVVKL